MVDIYGYEINDKFSELINARNWHFTFKLKFWNGERHSKIKIKWNFQQNLKFIMKEYKILWESNVPSTVLQTEKKYCHIPKPNHKYVIYEYIK